MKYKAEFRIVGTNTHFVLPVENYDDQRHDVHRDLAVWGIGLSLDLMGLEAVAEDTDEN